MNLRLILQGRKDGLAFHLHLPHKVYDIYICPKYPSQLSFQGTRYLGFVRQN